MRYRAQQNTARSIDNRCYDKGPRNVPAHAGGLRGPGVVRGDNDSRAMVGVGPEKINGRTASPHPTISIRTHTRKQRAHRRVREAVPSTLRYHAQQNTARSISNRCYEVGPRNVPARAGGLRGPGVVRGETVRVGWSV